MDLSKQNSDTLALVSKFLRDHFSPHLFQVFANEIEKNNIIPTQLDWNFIPRRPSFEEWNKNYDLYKNFTIEKIYKQVLLNHDLSPPPAHFLHKIRDFIEAREYGDVPRGLPSKGIFSKTDKICSVRCHIYRITQIVFDKTGKYFITASVDCLMKVWELESIRLLWTFRGHLKPINDMTISPDNSILASCCSERKVRLWRLKDGSYMGSLGGHTAHVSCVEFSPALQGNAMYLLCITDDGALFFWSYKVDEEGNHIFGNKPIKKFKGPKSGVKILSLSFSTGGLFLITGCSDSSIRVYSLFNGVPDKIADLAVDHGKVACVLYSHFNGKFVSGCSAGNVKVWNFHKNMWRATVLDRSRSIDNTAEGGNRVDGAERVGIRMLCWSCDDSRVITSYNDGIVAVWNANSGEFERFLKRNDSQDAHVAVTLDDHPNDPRVVAVYYLDGCLLLWDVLNALVLKKIVYNLPENIPSDLAESNAECLFSPCGNFIILSHMSEEITVYSSLKRISCVPEDQYFDTDFMPFHETTDPINIIDDETRLPYHFLPPPLMVDFDAFPQSNEIQQRVPGREHLPLNDAVITFDVGQGESKSAFGSTTNRYIIPIPDDLKNYANQMEDLFNSESERYIAELAESVTLPVEMSNARRIVGRMPSIVVEGRQIGINRMVLETDHDESSIQIGTNLPVTQEPLEVHPEEAVPEEIPEVQPETSTDDEDAIEYLQQYGYKPRDLLPVSESTSSSDEDARYYRESPPVRRTVQRGSRRSVRQQPRKRTENVVLPWWMKEANVPSLAMQPYVPQQGDRVVYFPRGHRIYVKNSRGKMDDKTLPWIVDRELTDIAFLNVLSFKITTDIKHYFNVKLEVPSNDGHRRGFATQNYTLRYHWDPSLPFFLVPESVYEKSLTVSWREGDRFRSLRSSNEEYYWAVGTVVTQRPLENIYPDSLFQSIIVSWDSDEIGKVSPWDIEPLEEDLDAPSWYQHTMSDDDWDGRSYFETEKGRLIDCLSQLAEMSIFVPFVEAVDFSEFERYLSVVSQPVDLHLIIDRLRNDCYRSRKALEREIKLISSNARTFNQPKSTIVSTSVMLVKACIKLIRDNLVYDPTPLVAQMETTEENQFVNEPDTLDPGQWEHSAYQIINSAISRDDFIHLQAYHDFFQQNCYRGVTFDDEMRRLKLGCVMSPLSFRDDLRNKFDGWLSLCRDRPRSRVFKALSSLETYFNDSIDDLIETWKSSARGLRSCRRNELSNDIHNVGFDSNLDSTRSNIPSHSYNTRQRSALLSISDSSCQSEQIASSSDEMTVNKRQSVRRRRVIYSDDNSSENVSEESSGETSDVAISTGSTDDFIPPVRSRRIPAKRTRRSIRRRRNESDRSFRYLLRLQRKNGDMSSDCDFFPSNRPKRVVKSHNVDND